MKLSQFDFELPQEKIAQEPVRWRDECRLMVLHKNTGEIEHRQFKDIIDYFGKIGKVTEMKFEFLYEMRVGEKTVCTAQSLHCFIENGRPVAISKRLPELYKAIQSQQ